MMFMNRYDIDRVAVEYRDHPMLGPATVTLRNLMDWTDTHSDGWAYWPKPSRAAGKLQALIQDAERDYYRGHRLPDITVAQLRAAYAPIKSFRTRQGADFTMIEPEVGR